MRRVLMFLVAGCVVWTLPVWAGKPKDSGVAGGGALRPRCTGEVVDAKGAPLAGATVEAYAFTSDHWRRALKVKLLSKVTTGAGGRFSFLAPADHVPHLVLLVARTKDRGIAWANWRPRWGGEFTLRLAGGVALAGTVVDSAGKPIAGAAVYPTLFTRGRKSPEPPALPNMPGMDLLVQRTDAKGRFRFAGIPRAAGAEFLVVAKGKANTFTYRGGGVPVGQFTTDQADIRISIPDEAKVSGTVVNKRTGRPVAGIRVTVRPDVAKTCGLFDEATTGADGAFTIGGLPGGEATVMILGPQSGIGNWVRTGMKIKLEAGKTASGVKLELIRGGVLEVKVTDADTGAPVPGAEVRNLPSGRYDGAAQRRRSGRTGTDGVFRIRLDPGTYRLAVERHGTHKRYRGEEDFEIVDGKTLKLEVKLQRLTVLVGVVRDPAGKSVAGAKVYLVPYGPFYGSTILTDAKGRFQITAAEQGRPFGRKTPLRAVARLSRRNLVGSAELRKDVELVEIKLAPGGRIAGHVVDPTGKAIAGATVSASPTGPWPAGWSYVQTATDAKGRYEFQALLPDVEYDVRASTDGYSRVRIGVKVPPKPKAPVQAEKIVLQPANLSVSGVVLDWDGKPVARARVYTRGNDQLAHVPPVTTDKQGKFKVVKLCKGKVRLSVRVHGKPGKTRGRTIAEAGDTAVEIRLEQPGSNRPAQRKPPAAPKTENF